MSGGPARAEEAEVPLLAAPARLTAVIVEACQILSFRLLLIGLGSPQQISGQASSSDPDQTEATLRALATDVPFQEMADHDDIGQQV